MPDFVFDDNIVTNLYNYITETFRPPEPYRQMIHDIIIYVAAQGLDAEESAEIISTLIHAIGITESDIYRIITS